MTRNIVVIDFDAASRNSLMAISMMELTGNSVKRIDDVATYDRTFPHGHGPDFALLGLNVDPATIFDISAHIVSAWPQCRFIAYATTPTPDLMMQAMAQDVRRFLPLPCTAAALDALFTTMGGVPNAPAPEKPRLSLPPHVVATTECQIIALYSSKGGVGTTTMAVNLACALRPKRVLAIDANISYGNLGMFLDTHTSRSMIDLTGDPADITFEAVSKSLLTHQPSGVKMLLSPPRPEDADQVRREHLKAILDAVKPHFDYVIVDTWPSYDERVLVVLDNADKIVMPVGADYAALKNAGAFLRVSKLLGYPKNRILPVLMRSDTVDRANLLKAENYLTYHLNHRVISDGIRVTASINRGIPFVIAEPKAPVSRNVFELARVINGGGELVEGATTTDQPFVSVVKRLFTRSAA